MNRVDAVEAAPYYPWRNTAEGGYHINGNGAASSATILEQKIFPSLDSLPKGALVADFGCGEGRIIKKAPHFSQRPYFFLGIEKRLEAVVSFNRDRRGLGFTPDRVLVGDLTTLEIGENRFAAGFCWRVLHSIDKEEQLIALTGIARTLKPGASLHVAARSDRDWVAQALRERGLYVPGQMNDFYLAMAQALDPLGIKSWNLYLFRSGELIRLGEEAGLEAVHEEPIVEDSGFKELREGKPQLSYDYVRFVKA